MSQTLQQIKANANIPAHVAVIMDGNGRWAQRQGNQRPDGHVAGVKTVRRIIEAASEAGISFLTLYAFSTENWNRPKIEVDLLLALIVSSLADETPNLIKNNVRLNAIGDLDRLPAEARASLKQSILSTSQCTGLQVNLALSYSSRWELTQAACHIAQQAVEGKISIDQINETTINSSLTTATMPDPDLLIRTGGDKRISNFLLWQIAYAELYFTQTLWPDFSREEFLQAILDFQSRERRFGMTSAQINNH